MPTSISESPTTSRRWRRLSFSVAPISGMAPAHDEEDAHVERHGHQGQQHHRAHRPPASLRQRRVVHLSHCDHLQCAQSSWYGCAHTAVGGVSKLWSGGGEGRVHSRPLAPSHTCAVAFSPPRMQLMTFHRKISCERPNMKPPMDDSMLRSVNCTG